MKSVSSGIRVVGCQPAASDVMRRSVAAGRILDVPSEDTLSDGRCAEFGGLHFDSFSVALICVVSSHM